MKDLKITTQKHIDGVWNTSEYEYKGHCILIKSREGKGIKAHAFSLDGKKVLFTLRYYFITPSELLRKMQIKLDNIR
jgi:hypothetical protein